METYIKSCTNCAQAQTSRQLPTFRLLEPLPIPCRPWSHMTMDFITDLPSLGGFNKILVAIDRFFEACQLVPLLGLPTTMETTIALFHQVFRTYGLPEECFLFCASASAQTNGQTEKPGNWLVLEIVLQLWTTALEWVPLWDSGISASVISLVRGALRHVDCGWVGPS